MRNKRDESMTKKKWYKVELRSTRTEDGGFDKELKIDGKIVKKYHTK